METTLERSKKSLQAIDWSGGQRLRIGPGETATCSKLTNQLYAIFLYNENGADKSIETFITGSNQQSPKSVTVPGTALGQGLASIVLVDGSQTTSISVNVNTTAPAGIDAWIGSLSMPTNTSGLSNRELPATGQPQPFAKYSRYYAVPASHWYTLTLQSNINQFYSVQFQPGLVTVFCVNPTLAATQSPQNITFFTDFDKEANFNYVPATEKPQIIQYELQGDGSQTVWMNADSRQDSQSATIALASLQSSR